MEPPPASTAVAKPKRKASVNAKDIDGREANATNTKRPRHPGDGAMTESARRGPQVMPSFRHALADRSTAGTSRVSVLCEEAEQLQKNGRPKVALNVLTRALISCVCHGPIRRQFKDAGVPLDAIDPVGHCSCRDFVAAAQTRRPQPSGHLLGLPPVNTTDGDDGSFAISELDLTAVYGLATNGATCTCGSGRIRCTRPDHLAALDRLAVVAAKLGRHEQASRVGQWYLDLAPQHAQGYLHVAKAVLALGGSGKTAAEKRESSRFAARCVYTHGLHNVRTHGDAAGHLAKVLERCCRQFSQGDYLPDLPVETAEAIFQHLSLRDVLICRRVSKRWAAVLRRIRLRVNRIVLAGHRLPQPKVLQQLARQMPGLQTRDLCIRYGLEQTRQSVVFVAAALRLFPNVERLELAVWPGDFPGTPAMPGPLALQSALSKCRSLVLRCVDPSRNRDAVLSLLKCTSANLESLELDGAIYDVVDFPLPRLRHLKATGGVWSNRFRETFLPSICMAAPRLEQLYLDQINVSSQPDVAGGAPPNDDDDSSDGDDQRDALFPSLHTLVLGRYVCLTADEGSREMPRLFPALPPGMRCLDILCTSPTLVDQILFPPPRQGEGGLRQFAHLEAFRCLCAIADPARLFEVIAPSLQSPEGGRLAHLELSVRDLPTAAVLRGDPPYAIPNPERLRTVGLHDFEWEYGSTHQLPGSWRGRAFLDWASQFRHAEAISVYPAWQRTGEPGTNGELVVALLEQAIQTPQAAEGKDGGGGEVRLRTIYQGMLRGMMRTRAEAVIGDRGIRIPRDAIDYRPPVFPWPNKTE